MVKADDSCPFQQHSAWHSPNLNYTSKLLPPAQQNSLQPCMNPCIFSTNVAFPGYSVSALPGSRTGQANGTHGLSQSLPPLVESSVFHPNPYLIESQSAFPPGDGYVQKRFLIFDQSGNQTRLFFSPFGSSSHNPFVAPLKHEVSPVPTTHLHDEKQATIVQQISPTKPIIQEKLGGNHVIDEGSEMHEDTEEINALLYSDDDDNNEDDEDDDEVTSTGHSPFAIKGSHGTFEQWEVTEEVASSDGLRKRQKLFDGGFEKSSLVDSASLVKLDRSCKYDGDDAESSCASLGNKRSRKDNIEETLKILEGIIPGSKIKDPLLIIDEAIDYLKSLKLKAKALGVSYP